MQSAEVQLFAKSIMPLFSIGTLLLFLNLALQMRRSVYFLGLVLYGILSNYLYDPSYIVSGYVDIGVSFFAFLSFHVMYSRQLPTEKTHPHRYLKHIRLAVVFAAAAAITKQAGLFILAIILVWVFAGLYRHRETIPFKKIISTVLTLVLTVLFITASWYIIKEIQISSGLDRSEVPLAQGANREDNYIKRFSRGVGRILSHRPAKLKAIAYAIVILIILGLFHRRSRWIVLTIVLPFTLMWGLFFSYDSRNLALAVPFM
ncbi:MAG: hypothetical protein GY940_26925, partial [bacterium]|nr:hypothetical protein [bacterium]